MKKIFAFMAVAALIMGACGNNQNKENQENKENKENNENKGDNVEVVEIDDLLANGDNFVGKEVVIEGVVSHLCSHGGTKAFLVGSKDNIMIRCNATADMGGRFAPETVHKVIRVNGTVCEDRIDEETIKAMEAQHAATVAAQAEAGVDNDSEEAVGCETERKAEGMEDVKTFEDKMAAYRARIAERNAAEGKDYLSTYYVKAKGYEIVED